MNYFFDVGAGRGEIFTLDDVVPPERRKETALVCIEPSPRNFVHLMEQAEQHGKEWLGICLWSVAVSGGDGQIMAPLHLKTDHSGDSLRREWASNEEHPYRVAVPVLPIDVAIGGVLNEPWHHIALKLDCEGVESKILKQLLDDGRIFKRGAVIWVEWHDADPAGRSFLEREYRQRGLELQPWNH